jgi:multidrug transporter EmrE-like cation transporter
MEAVRTTSASTMPYAVLGTAIAFEVAGMPLLQKSGQFTRVGPTLDVPAMVGMAMIIGGVVVLQAFSATTGH